MYCSRYRPVRAWRHGANARIGVSAIVRGTTGTGANTASAATTVSSAGTAAVDAAAVPMAEAGAEAGTNVYYNQYTGRPLPPGTQYDPFTGSLLGRAPAVPAPESGVTTSAAGGAWWRAWAPPPQLLPPLLAPASLPRPALAGRATAIDSRTPYHMWKVRPSSVCACAE